MTLTAAARIMRDVAIAGMCGTFAQIALRETRRALGVLPDFQPYLDLQRQLLQMGGSSLPPLLQVLLPFISGALVWSSIFAWAYPWIPGRTALLKGLSVTALAWLLTGPLKLGPTGAFISIAVAFSVFALLGAWVFRRGRWKQHRV